MFKKLAILIVFVMFVLGMGGAITAQQGATYEGLQTVVPHVDEAIQDRHWASSEPAWSPDGTKIAFVSDRDCGDLVTDLFIMNSDGTNVVNLTGNCKEASNPDWSPDGRYISFNSLDMRDYQRSRVHIFDTQTGEITTLLGDSERTNNLPHYRQTSWSPDGSQIAFSSQEVVGGRTLYGVYVMNRDGSDIHLIAEHGTGVDWSVTGKILFISTVSDVDQDQLAIFTINPDGSELEMVGEVRSDYAVWSPDGTQILYRGYPVEGAFWGGLFKVGSDGTDPVQLSAISRAHEAPDWGISGVLYHSSDQGGYGLFLLDPSIEMQLERHAVNEEGAYTPRYPQGNNVMDIDIVEHNGPETGIVELLRNPIGTYGILEANWLDTPDAKFHDEEGVFAQINRRGIEGVTQIEPGLFVYGWKNLICIADFSTESEDCYDVSFGGRISRPYVMPGSVALGGNLIAFVNDWGIGLLDVEKLQYQMVWDTPFGNEWRASINEEGTSLMVYHRTWDAQTLYRYHLQSGALEVVEEPTSQSGPMRFAGESLFGITETNGGTIGRHSVLAGFFPDPVGSGVRTQLMDVTNRVPMFAEEIGTIVSFDFAPDGQILVVGVKSVTAEAKLIYDTTCGGAGAGICTASYGFDVGPITLWQCDVQSNTCTVVMESDGLGLFRNSLDPIALQGFVD